MRLHSTVQQVLEVLNSIKMTGESKFSAKEEFRKDYDGSHAIDKFMHEFAKKDGIHSDQTFKDYLAVNINFANFVKTEFGIKNIENITAEHAKAFLVDKAREGLSKASIQKYSSTLEKFETALSLKYQKEFNLDVKNALSDKQKGSLKVTERAGYHPYDNPKAIIDNIKANPNIADSHKIAIKITAETGLRLHKAIAVAGIKINPDSITTNTKGGRLKELNLSQNLRTELKAYLGDKQSFKLTQKDYKQILSELKVAAAATNQRYQATYGFRHSFALDKASQLQSDGMSYKEAWNSEEHNHDMDHNRFVDAYTRG